MSDTTAGAGKAHRSRSWPPAGDGYAVWGWGSTEDAPAREDLESMGPYVRDLLGFEPQAPEPPMPPRPLPPPRVRPPAALAGIASDEPADRARHGLGRSYADVLRGLRGEVRHAPDLVLRPRDEAGIAAVLEWCAGAGAAVIPYGGGTSVVGGVEPDVGEGFPATVSLDLGAVSGVAEIDPVAMAARVRAGTSGPDLEARLKADGLTLRFYPQSFTRSTVGGWLATRAAGHFATRATHIDDLVEAVRMVTPAGLWASRRLPGSGAGPSPDRLALGSEGTLGVITEAWLRVQRRPRHRAGTVVAFPDFAGGAAAARAIVQAGLTPSACRLVDPVEAAYTGTLAGGEAALVLGFESTSLPVGADLAAALELCGAAGGRALDDGGGATGAWRSSFVQAPLLRERLMLLGVLAETFETAITWDRLDQLVAEVRAATAAALTAVCGAGTVTCRLTHVYPDGAAPYFTVLAPARRGSELSQWAEIKAAASEAILAAGGTITHHHAVGRDHRRWYDRQRPDPFAHALRAAKATLDPAGILNPGVLIDPHQGPSPRSRSPGSPPADASNR